MFLKILVTVLLVIDIISIKVYVNSGRGMFFTLMKLQESTKFDLNNTNIFCNQLMKLQRSICLRHVGLIPSVIHGVDIGIQECQHQFFNSYWNCAGHNLSIPDRFVSQSKKKHRKTYLDNLINKGLPESAFLLSMTSAAVAHQVSKACSSGQNKYCGCDRTIYETPEDNFQWAGCSDNVHFGAAFSKRFLDSPHKRKIKRNPSVGLVNLHNSHAGTKIVIDNMMMKCKCHGVSGSCETKTCYRALPDLRKVGDILKEKFSKAILVRMNDFKLVPMHSGESRITEHDLTYLKRSPNFCYHNPSYGSLGTQGRLCNNTQVLEHEFVEGSCAHLCCKRGFSTKQFLVKEKCQCKFVWCCTVQCQTCEILKVESRCN
uniref:Protein Wnt n=1 Tax=Schmidtea mediterranea TaxID=79327 RepID=B0LMF8_SCHMD|nr:wntP-3 [Schmidtea mediterranea]